MEKYCTTCRTTVETNKNNLLEACSVCGSPHVYDDEDAVPDFGFEVE